MIDIQKQFSEQLEQVTQYQKEAVEKLQAKSAAGVDSWEKFARYNIAVMNDVVEFSVEQARLAAKASEPEEFFNKQIDNASAFAKVVEGRTKEYIDMLSSAASTATEELQEATKESVVKAVNTNSPTKKKSA
jgi:molybdopterin converting factor small subunit